MFATVLTSCDNVVVVSDVSLDECMIHSWLQREDTNNTYDAYL